MKNTLNEGIIDNILSKIFSILFSTQLKHIQTKVKALNKQLKDNNILERPDIIELKHMIDDKHVMTILHKSGNDKSLLDLYDALIK